MTKKTQNKKSDSQKINKNKKHKYDYSIIAIVAIVAIVGIVLGILNMNNNLTIQSLGNPPLGEGDLAGEATYSKYTCDYYKSLGYDKTYASWWQTACASWYTTTTTTSCKDTDGGKVITTKGTASYTTYNYTDKCMGPDRLLENWCSSSVGFPSSYYVDCPCSDGKCTGPEYTCADTDGGKVITAKGTASKGPAIIYPDKCTSSYRLLEYWCYSSTSSPSGYYADCPCYDGKCTGPEYTCSDTDGGKNLEKAGTASKGPGISYSDKCSSTTRLLEYWCRSTTSGPEGYYADCSYGCENGVCKPAPQTNQTNTTTTTTSSTTTTTLLTQSCTDSDGDNQFVMGRVTLALSNGTSSSVDDACASGTLLAERICTSSVQYQPKMYTCTYGCENGVCKPAPATTTTTTVPATNQTNQTNST